jgi:RHS repeat-associated protein
LVYSDFGEPLADTSASGTPTLSRLYAGYAWDGSPVNFYWMKGRQSFGPALGRFSQEDPIVNLGFSFGSSPLLTAPPFAYVLFPQGWNRYVYVTNSPQGYVDPSGLWYNVLECGCEDNPEDVRSSIEEVRKMIRDLKKGISYEDLMKGKKVVAITVCIPGIVAWPEYYEETKSCRGQCLKAHEETHVRQCLQGRPHSEIEAYLEQLTCLINAQQYLRSRGKR